MTTKNCLNKVIITTDDTEQINNLYQRIANGEGMEEFIAFMPESEHLDYETKFTVNYGIGQWEIKHIILIKDALYIEYVTEGPNDCFLKRLSDNYRLAVEYVFANSKEEYIGHYIYSGTGYTEKEYLNENSNSDEEQRYESDFIRLGFGLPEEPDAPKVIDIRNRFGVE